MFVERWSVIHFYKLLLRYRKFNKKIPNVHRTDKNTPRQRSLSHQKLKQKEIRPLCVCGRAILHGNISLAKLAPFAIYSLRRHSGYLGNNRWYARDSIVSTKVEIQRVSVAIKYPALPTRFFCLLRTCDGRMEDKRFVWDECESEKISISPPL
jgi:hypothetical protein